MATNQSTPRRFEPLESKQMLAGDVLVSVTEGVLSVQGDELDNQIAITSGPTAGSYLIRGLTGTTVRMNGVEPTDPPAMAPETGVVVEGVTGNVRVAMGEGDDTVLIDDADFRGNVSIATGEGADQVLVGTSRDDVPGPQPADPISEGADEAEDMTTDRSVRVGRSLRIATGAGEDTVAVRDTAVGRHLVVGTGEDADTVRLGELLPPASEDPLSDTAPEAEGRASVAARGAVSVRLGAGDDSLAVNSVQSRMFRVNGGLDADTMRLNSIDSALMRIHGGRGDASDTIIARDLRARAASIETGAGEDSVAVLDSAFGQLSVALGAGDDTLAVGGVSARGAILNGGAGEADTLRNLEENRIGRRIVRGFELPSDDEGTIDA